LFQDDGWGYAGSKLTVVDAGDVDELLLGALLHGLQRRCVPGPLRDVAALPVDDTLSHLFAPCDLRSCTNHPTENKTNAQTTLHKLTRTSSAHNTFMPNLKPLHRHIIPTTTIFVIIPTTTIFVHEPLFSMAGDPLGVVGDVLQTFCE